MDLLILMGAARNAGLTLAIHGDKLEICGPKRAKSIADKLGANKLAVIAELRRQATVNVLWQPSLLLTGHDWDSPLGYSLGRRIVRDGIEHKREDCTGRQGWRHVWGGTYCCHCWPCTDANAKEPERQPP
jgi:hypothetical protein